MGRVYQSYFGWCDRGGLKPVFFEKLGLCIAESGGVDEVANAASERAEPLAEKKAGRFHFAGLLFDVAPIWSDSHWRKEASKILQPPRSESGLQAENVPRRMWRRIVSV